MAMKGTMANNHLSKLAAKGRGRDSEIARTSSGELWHVTPEEKSLMNMYGMEGERMVDAIGSGTINPETGLEEKEPITATIMAVTALAAAGMQGIGAYKTGRASELQAESERDTADIGLQSIEDAIRRLEQSTTKGRAAVMTDFGQAVETESFKTGVQKEDLFQGTSKALQQSGMATAGSVEQQSSLAWNRIRDRWSMKGDSLLADLGKRMGKIEGNYEAEMARLQTEKSKLEATRSAAEKRRGSWYLGKNIGKAGRWVSSMVNVESKVKLILLLL
jgi:hypothetical protein